MTPFSDIPINSLSWMVGTFACLALAVKSWLVYRNSYNQLTKYMAWFGGLIAIAIGFFGFPSLFTLDEDLLHLTYIIGEFFMYVAFIAQAAILWSLVLRRYVPVWALTVPVGLIGLSAWAYATPNSELTLLPNFVDYSEPGICSFLMAMLLVGLFVPVGFHFLRATMRQVEIKAKLTTFVLGMVYLGVGVSSGAHLLLIGHAVSPASSEGNLLFFAVLLTALVWPRRMPTKSVLPETPQLTNS